MPVSGRMPNHVTIEPSLRRDPSRVTVSAAVESGDVQVTYFLAFLVIGWVIARSVANVLENFYEITPEGVYGVLAIITYVSSIFFAFRRRYSIPSTVWWSLIVLFYILFLFVVGVTRYSYITSFAALSQGMIGLSLPILIFLVAQRAGARIRQKILESFLGPLLCISSIMSVGYYFFGMTFGGIIQHPIYTDLIYRNANIDLRAIGLFSSPQSHALSMVVLLLVGVLAWRKHPYRAATFIAFAMIGGVLSGSKAFFLGAAAIGLTQIAKRNLFILIGLLPLVLIGWIGANYLASIGWRAFTLFEVAQDASGYTAFPLWMAALEFVQNFWEAIFGLGLGSMGSMSEFVGASALAYTSTESYLLQVAVETGLLGIALFLVFIGAGLRDEKRPQEPFIDIFLFLSVFMNSVFTPAFYGVQNAALLGLLLAHSGRMRKPA